MSQLFRVLLFIMLLPHLSSVAQVSPDVSETAEQIIQQNAPRIVCSNDILLYRLRQQPFYKAREEEMNRRIEQLYGRLPNNIVILPVVVHIVNTVPGAITDLMVMNGINDLNDAFSKSGAYTGSVGADTRIRFCLAKKSPDGGNTTGITRTQNSLGDNLNMDNEDERLKSLVRWDPAKYINVWLVNSISGEAYSDFNCGAWYRLGISGYATMPPAATETDGIVTTSFGKVLAHEMGHYLGLYHTFEGGCRNYNCLVDGDRVCDTPPDNSVRPSPSCAVPSNTCNSDTASAYSNGNFFTNVPDQISNFMDYGNTICSNTFTQGQADRMQAMILSERSGLLNDVCTPPCADNVAADFLNGSPSPVTGNSVMFTNTSTGAVSYTWLVNNVIVSGSLNLNYTFSVTGNVSVTLRAYGASGCFASETKYLQVNCGVSARFYTDKNTVASSAGIYTDSITFTNTSLQANNYAWLVSNDQGMNETVVSTDSNLVYTFGVPGNYYIRLVAGNGSCTDTTAIYTVPVLDPTSDGTPFNISLLCYDTNKIKVRFCVTNNGFAPLPQNTPVNFYDKNPALPNANRISPTFYLPAAIPGKCYACYNHVLDVEYRYVERVYVVFNDIGNAIPVVLPNATLPELSYTNNIASSAGNRTTVNKTICNGQSYQGYTASGTYIDTLASIRNGCDSIRTLNLTVLPSFASEETVTICQGQSFMGHDTSGSYITHFTAMNGCDSVHTLNLIVNPNITYNTTAVICQGQSFEGYSATGVYTDHFTAANGCDSARILTLTVNPVLSSTITASICQGQNYSGHTTTGTYVDIYPAANGCDSTRTLLLTVIPAIVTNLSVTLCPGDSYAGYSVSGVYTDIFTTADGCDSTRILTLTVRPVVTSSVTATICQGDSFEGYSASGLYTDVFTGSNGCDSTRTLALTVNAAIATTYQVSICQGESHQGYSVSGTYVDVFTATNGCDSTRTLNLTVRPTVTASIVATICSGESFAGYTVSGVYTDHFIAANGCDSTRILTLTVNPLINTSISASICQGESFEGYSVTGIYTNVYTGSNGCDSIRTLNLMVRPTVATTVTASICEGEQYAGHSTSGTFTDVYPAANGCDSTRTLFLTVKPRLYTTIDITLCEGEQYAGYTTSGTYTDVFTAANGCDSTRTLRLVVNPRKYTNVPVSFCRGGSYFAQGQWQTEPGVYYDTARSSLFCDSVIITTITVNPLPVPDLGPDRNLCFGEFVMLNPGSFSSYNWHNGGTSQYNQASAVGEYAVTVTNSFGCSASDTMKVLRVLSPVKDFLPKDTTICRGSMLKVNISGFAEYLWNTGSTADQIEITTAGLYSLRVKNVYGCFGTDTINVRLTNCITIQIPNAFTPNNDGNNDVFRPLIPVPVTNYRMQIYNRSGQLLFESADPKRGWDGTYRSARMEQGSYVYVISLTDADGVQVKKNGSLLLLR